MKQIAEMKLANGSIVLVEVSDSQGGATKTGALDSFDFAAVSETLKAISLSLKESLDKAKPTSVIVELGLELAIKSGKLTGLLVEGSGRGTFRVTLGWGNDIVGK